VFPVSLCQFVLYVSKSTSGSPVFCILLHLVLRVLTLACFWTFYPPA
jgi:hypothetical protein